MSTFDAVGAAVRRVTAGQPRPAGPARPDLRVVPRPAFRAPRIPFVLLVVLLLGGGLVGLLLVNTSLQQGAFAVYDLEREAAVLTDRRQQLTEGLAELEAPDSLARRARQLRMVPNTNPVFLHLGRGAVLGTPTPAEEPPPPPEPVRKPTPTPKPEPAPGSRR